MKKLISSISEAINKVVMFIAKIDPKVISILFFIMIVLATIFWLNCY